MYEEKAAQAAALFLLKAGGPMPHLKLMKLLYIADRESYRRHSSPITGDEMVSMPHGPVLSHTLDLMKGAASSAPDGWSRYVCRVNQHAVTLADGVTWETFLGKLSRGDRWVIDEVWERYGRMSQWELRDLTHEFPEWEDPRGSSKPIERYTLFRALGMSHMQAEARVEQNEEREAIDAAFERMYERAGKARA